MSGLVAAAIPLSAASGAHAKQNMIVEQESAVPGATVVVRTSQTPRDYEPPPHPSGPQLAVQFARLGDGARGPTTSPVATLQLDVDYRGAVSFPLPELTPGIYAVRVRMPQDRQFDYGWATSTVRIEARRASRTPIVIAAGFGVAAFVLAATAISRRGRCLEQP